MREAAVSVKIPVARRRTITAVLLAVGLASPELVAQVAPGPPLPEPRTESQITRIERGLMGAVQIRGREPRRFALADRMAFYRVPAVSVAVVHRGALAWSRAWGFADVAAGRRATPSTLFQAASMSKPVAALAALRLVERGRLGLDDDVNEHLVSWKLPRDDRFAGEPVTLRRLLSHTAGLGVHGFLGYASGEPVPTPREVLDGDGPANSPPVRVDIAPGSAWRYSGGGYTVVQQLVEDVEGRPFAEIMRDLLSELGMRESVYEQPLPAERAPLAATPYRNDGLPVEGGWHTYPELAAAGLWTTPTDLARYVLAVGRWLEGDEVGVLGPEMTRTMLEPVRDEWGLGPSTAGSGADLRFGHGGANEGYRGQFIAFPRRGEGAVVMTNGDGGGALVDEILFAIAREYGWPEVAPRWIDALPLSADEAREYVGRYRLADAADVTVSIRWRGGGLVLAVGEGPPSSLARTGRDRFVILESGALLRFERDGGGRVTAARAYGSRAERIPAP